MSDIRKHVVLYLTEEDYANLIAITNELKKSINEFVSDSISAAACIIGTKEDSPYEGECDR